MMKNKFIYIIVFCLSLVVCVDNAEAKIDIPGVVGKAVEAFSRTTDKLSEKWKNVERKVNESRIGDGISEYKALRKKGKDLQTKVEDKIDEGEKAVADAKEKVEDAKETVEEKIGVDAETSKKLAKLEIERANIVSEFDSRIQSKNDYYNNLVSVIDGNIQEANQEKNKESLTEAESLSIQDRIDTLNQNKSNTLADQKNDISDINREKTQMLQSIDAQISDLREQIALSQANRLKDKKSGEGEEYWSSMDTQTAMDRVKDDMFLKEGEAQTSANVEKIRRSRRARALKEAMNAMNVAMLAETELIPQNNEVKEMVEDQTILESQNASISVDMNVKLEELKALLRYNKVLLAEMKFKAASSLSRINDYNFTDENRDITKFNLDDYSFEKNCKGR